MIAPRLPRALKHFNIYVDGIPYQEKCESVTLPNLNFVVESFRAGGMDFPVDIEMGMEQLTLSMTIADCSPELLGLLGKPNIDICLRGSVQAQGAPAEKIAISMRGFCKGYEPGQWQPGTKAVTTINYTLNYFKYVQNGVEVVEIDGFNMVRKFNGVDQLAEHRENLGL
ncbi:phage major tail tube protein [Bartonella bovis]|uniref:Phage tail tube protein FII n=1 Tax=Bartonella bovis 91-4 TaxID=1094491 RepID=N6URE9_9HYPH|nr:phage major tail tube protein [Bartonella bovis]ENN91153.1 phage tail tube protein FII [Bartonella bovis 91-4]ENN92688.1 phage tail tube protein FII [Bartonella bovis 91-4]